MKKLTEELGFDPSKHSPRVLLEAVHNNVDPSTIAVSSRKRELKQQEEIDLQETKKRAVRPEITDGITNQGLLQWYYRGELADWCRAHGIKAHRMTEMRGAILKYLEQHANVTAESNPEVIEILDDAETEALEEDERDTAFQPFSVDPIITSESEHEPLLNHTGTSTVEASSDVDIPRPQSNDNSPPKKRICALRWKASKDEVGERIGARTIKELLHIGSERFGIKLVTAIDRDGFRIRDLDDCDDKEVLYLATEDESKDM